ncbi:DUF3307 domain-containing protein [Algoriphagus sp.]|uniref:DUF3307 domain-containing protein n=1 Tax=Algoriphagus sp. TaxID=1872435 RepID=UPI0025F96A63|nr:DUF3307 domain-containing protein [Algoriphagus sp.]
MEIQQLDLLLRLILAHLLADFVFQTNAMVKGKKEGGLGSTQFLWHLVIVAILTYIFLADWTNWWTPIAIGIVHGLIDWVKIRINRDTVGVYIADQAAHLISIIILWTLITGQNLGQIFRLSTFEWNSNFQLIIIAYIIVTLPSGILIGYLTLSWQEQLSKNKKDESLKDAGKWIGIIERILILTFILLNQWQPIGFLLAAKSVFRFGDLKKAKEQKKTEYILIGTLLSFTLAIFIGLFTQMAIS